MIEVNEVWKQYETVSKVKVDALKGVSFQLPDRGLVSIVGRSGCGKTTLLNMLGALDFPTKGEILITDRNSGETIDVGHADEKTLDWYRNEYMGFVFQEFHLISNWTVEQNIRLAIEQQDWEGKTEEACDKRVEEVLAYVELEGMEKRYIKELSGGQQQRVAIARAIIKSPQLLIADEPTGNLDYESGENIMQLLRKIAEECLVVLVTHSQEIAEDYSDYIIKMRDGIVLEKIENATKEIQVDQSELFVNRKEVIRTPLAKTELLRYAFSNLRIRKIRMVLFFVLLTLCMCAIKIVMTFATADHGKAVSAYLTAREQNIIYPQKSIEYRDKGFFYDTIMVGNSIEIYEDLKEMVDEDQIHMVKTGCTLWRYESSEELQVDLVVGGQVEEKYPIIGALPKGNNEIAVTDYVLSHLGFSQGGIGEIILCDGLEMKITGIIQTNYEYYKKLLASQENEYGFPTDNLTYEEHATIKMLEEYVWNRTLVAGTYVEYVKENSEKLLLSIANPVAQTVSDDIGRKTCYQSVNKLTESDELIYGRLPERTGEIAVSYDFALENAILTLEDELIDYAFAYQDIHSEEKNKAFTGYLNMAEYLPGMKIVGIVSAMDFESQVFLLDEDYQMIRAEYYEKYYADEYEVTLTNRQRNSSKLFSELEKGGITIDCAGIGYAYSADDEIFTARFYFTVAVGILLIVFILLSILFFSFNIKDNQEKVGILRALGTTESDITKMFLVETMLVGVFLEIISVVVNTIFFWKFNEKQKIAYEEISNVIFHNVSIELVEFVVMILILLLTVIVPLAFMVQNRPVKLMRGTGK